MDIRSVAHRSRLLAACVAAIGWSPSLAADSQLGRCLAIADVQARVECYDRIARAESETPARPEPARAARAAPPRQLDPQADFGLDANKAEARAAVREQRLDRLALKVSAARPVGADSWEFAMADGSLWRLAETRRAFRAPRPGDTVDVERGTLGSYLLRFDKQVAMRVRRIR